MADSVRINPDVLREVAAQHDALADPLTGDASRGLPTSVDPG